MSDQKFPFYFTSCCDNTYKVYSFSGVDNVEMIFSSTNPEKVGRRYSCNSNEILSYIKLYEIIYDESIEKVDIDYKSAYNTAHETIRKALGLTDADRSFNHYAEIIDNLVGDKLTAEMDQEWDHLDLMSLVKYLKSTGLSIAEIKQIAREWQK